MLYYLVQMQAAFVLLFSGKAEITDHFMFFDLPLGGLFFAPSLLSCPKTKQQNWFYLSDKNLNHLILLAL
ncbi:MULTISPECIES: hypothetical protein [unclassified Vibrio]|uniref:hypothetical protein n=1 Tax=unclassified Vibrio TaxID=2614977 RepID=UPI0010A5B80E|nr:MULTISPECIES: hypothetical protein [unclassified Vibrio]WGY45550.1 hypothetical protein J0X00_01485 [Vibrio sp. ABG19]